MDKRIAYCYKGKYYTSVEKAESAKRNTKVDARVGDIETVELLSDQIIRMGRIVTLTSAVHHQRHSPCLVLIQCDTSGVPFRLTVLPVNHEYIPRRDVMPFDCYVGLGAVPSNEGDRAAMVSAFGLESMFDLFEQWVEKCKLGVSAIQEPRKFLPMFIDFQQYEVFKQLHLDEFFTNPIRIMESIMAFTNDVSWAQGKDVQFGKDSYTQFAAKCRNEIARAEQGPIRLDKLARAYNYHLLTR